jgi:hypothetical protein
MATVELTAATPRWNPATRIGFRFLFVYFFVCVFAPFNQLGGTILWNLLGLHDSVGSWWKGIVAFVGERVFGATITAMPFGSGDTTFNYVELFFWAAIAAIATVVWSIADRKRLSYPRLFEVLRVGVRLVLAYQMILYGTCKVVPTQFGTVGPTRLVTPLGEMTPMGLLWTFMAASPVYTIFGGAAELLGGLLLVFRRTTLLGALVSAGVMTQVVMLNLCYDVPVKLLSSQLLSMAIFLALPDAKRLWDFFVVSRPIVPAPVRPRFQRRWLNWSITSVIAGLFLFVTYDALVASYSGGEMMGYFGPQPRLQGVWDVAEFQRDGQVVPPLATDAIRWKQVIVENVGFAVVVSVQPMTGPGDLRIMELSEEARRMNLTDFQETAKPPITLTYEEPAPDSLVLSGTVDGKTIRVELHRVQRFNLLNRGFHWINEVPASR